MMKVSKVNLFVRVPQLQLPSSITQYLLYDVDQDLVREFSEASVRLPVRIRKPKQKKPQRKPAVANTFSTECWGSCCQIL